MRHYPVRNVEPANSISRPFLPLLLVAAIILLGISNTSAQQTPPNASAGAILGWELNMSRTVQQQQNILLKPLPSDNPEEPVIQYERVPVNTGEPMPLLLRNATPATKPAP